jgi:hypothetical protein
LLLDRGAERHPDRLADGGGGGEEAGRQGVVPSMAVMPAAPSTAVA